MILGVRDIAPWRNRVGRKFADVLGPTHSKGGYILFTFYTPLIIALYLRYNYGY